MGFIKQLRPSSRIWPWTWTWSLILTFLLLLLNKVQGSSGAKLDLTAIPGEVLNIPLEFHSPQFSPDTPGWITYSGGALRAVVGSKENALYRFSLSEDGSSVDVQLRVITPHHHSSNSGLNSVETSGSSGCSSEVKYEEPLSLEQKLEYAEGFPGRIIYSETPEGITILKYSTPCIVSDKTPPAPTLPLFSPSRPRRADKDLDNDDDDDDRLIETGSGDGDHYDDTEDDAYNEGDDLEPDSPIVPVVPTPSFTSSSQIENLQPSPTLILESLPPQPVLESSSNPDIDLGLPSISPTPTLSPSSEILLSSSPTYHRKLNVNHALPPPDPEDNFDNFAGSGDIEILPSPTLELGPISSTPILEPTPPPPPPPGQTGPILRKKIEKLSIEAGNTLKFKIPEATFLLEPGHGIKYDLEMTDADVIGLPSWIKLNSDIIEIITTHHEISDYTLQLTATDTVTGESTVTEILLSVRQRQKSRLHNHEFELEFKKSQSTAQLFSLPEAISKFAGGVSNSPDDLVLNYLSHEGPTYSIKWTNESLTGGYNRNNCPKDDLAIIYARFSSPSGEPTPALTSTLSNMGFLPIHFKVHLTPNSFCDGVLESEITKFEPTTQSPPIRITEDEEPKIRNPIDSLVVFEGEFLEYQIKEDFCSDLEDGGTRRLKLELLGENMEVVDETSWLQLDEKNQELFGLPFIKNSKTSTFAVKCSDSNGQSANEVFVITINPQTQTNYAAEFRLQFKSQKLFNTFTIRKFLNKLASAFNDSISNIVVKEYQESIGAEPEVHFLWFNKSNPRSEFEITELRKIMLSDEGPLNKRLVESFKPEFRLSYGSVTPKGKLVSYNTPTHPFGEPKEEDGGGGSTFIGTRGPSTIDEIMSRDYLITYIIPSVLIAVMILLAAVIACLLSRKRKAIPIVSREETRGFIKKGVPVIFQDELGDDKGARSRSPAILKDEHPPLPPQYRRSPAPLAMDHSHMSSYQPPPAPIPAHHHRPNMAGGGPNSRSARPGVTNFRKPPPYVPP